MHIADNIINQSLKNVYFLIGASCAGKTTAAKELSRKYGMYHYSSDEMRSKHFANASSEFQPCMTRPDIDSLSIEEAGIWEGDIVREFTPMMIVDLIELSAIHGHVVCDGDIDTQLLFQVVDHKRIMCLLVCPRITKMEFFERPDHIHMLNHILNKADITADEKNVEIQKMRTIAGVTEIVPEDEIVNIPVDIIKSKIQYYVRDDKRTVKDMMLAIEQHFGLEI